MTKRDVPIAAAVVAALGGACWALSQASMIGRPELEASAGAAARPVGPAHVVRPVADRDYAVPGVLDYRSWKPAYDVMPSRSAYFSPRALHRAHPGAVSEPIPNRSQTAPTVMASNTPLPEDELPAVFPASATRPAVVDVQPAIQFTAPQA